MPPHPNVIVTHRDPESGQWIATVGGTPGLEGRGASPIDALCSLVTQVHYQQHQFDASYVPPAA